MKLTIEEWNIKWERYKVKANWIGGCGKNWIEIEYPE